MREVNSEQMALYEQSKAELNRLIDEELKQLNDLAAEIGLKYLSAVTPQAGKRNVFQFIDYIKHRHQYRGSGLVHWPLVVIRYYGLRGSDSKRKAAIQLV